MSATAPKPDRPIRDLSARVALLAATAGIAIYMVQFFSVALPNNPEMSRPVLLGETPRLLLDLLVPESGSRDLPSGWTYLSQRFPTWGCAATILLVILTTGSVLLKSFQLDVTRSEAIVLAYGLGVALIATLTLAFGLAGQLTTRLFLTVDGVLLLTGLTMLAVWRRGSGEIHVRGRRNSRPKLLHALVWVVFGGCMLLAASLPPVDFDVREYHLQGPREFFETGSIHFLRHNVYTSFPFLTEMLSLHAMVLCNDWFAGALAGKVVLMFFGPMTALAAGCVAARFFGQGTGWFATLVCISTPWTYRISTIAYAEGGLSYFTILTALAFVTGLSEGDYRKQRWMLMIGMLAGSAMACKYPAALSVVLPVLVAAVVHATRSPEPRQALVRWTLMLAMGGAITVGPWLIRNLVDAGNPVYPLAWSILGGDDWDEALNAKWKRAHSSTDFSVSALGQNALDVTLRNDWLSALLFPFAAVGFLSQRRQTAAWLFGGLILYQFFVWWLLTHRIDRFWIPMIPLVAVLSAAGINFSNSKLWQVYSRSVVASVTLFNLAFITTVYCGNNSYLADLDALTRIVAKQELRILNRRMGPNDKVLCVGEAEVFDARFPLLYHTVFDHAILEDWSTDSKGNLLPPERIHRKLDEQGITYVYVNWREILRYRTTYGYTDFVSPGLFDELVRQHVLRPPIPLLELPIESFSPDQRQAINRWGRELLERNPERDVIPAGELYQVPLAAER